MLNLQMRLLLLALVAWTRLPLRATVRHDAGPAAGASGTRYLPVAGMAVALPSAVAYAVAGVWLPHAVALLVALAAMLALTGAVHERGFAGWCDDLSAGRRAQGPLGVAGAAGLVMLVLARFETLSSVDPSWIALSMVCAAAFSRGCAVFALGTAFHPEASVPAGEPPEAGAGRAEAGRHDGRAGIDRESPPTTPTTGTDAVVAFACGLLPVAGAALWTGDLEVFGTAGAMALLAVAVVRRTLARRHLPRDARALGALQQLAELGFHIGILATLSIIDETLADPAS